MRLLPSLPQLMPEPSLTEPSASAAAKAGAKASVANAARASSHATA